MSIKSQPNDGLWIYDPSSKILLFPGMVKKEKREVSMEASDTIEVKNIVRDNFSENIFDHW